MSANDGTFERGSLVGNVNLPRLSQPQIRGTVRRSDPDGSHASPYWSGLNGTSLTIEIGTFQAGPVTTTTISFTSDNYPNALNTVNTAGGTDFHWLETGGFICIQSLHSGDKNYLRVTGGTAAAVLGIAIDPAPGGYSQAGDIAPASPTQVQSNQPTTKLVALDENLTSAVVNRAIAGSVSGLDRVIHDLSREVAVWRLVALKFAAAGGLILNSTADANIRISAGALKQAIADGYAVEDLIQILDGSRKAYYKATSPVTRVNATGVSYGPGVGTGALTWGTPGSGNLLSTTAAITSLKQAATGITAISGSTITASGATFVTNRVQANDIVSIKSATNLTPFSHNGEFVVVNVISETQLVVRPMGPNETLVDSTEDKPPALNGTSSGLGTIQVYVGYSVPMGGKTASGTDFVYIETNVSDTTGTQAWARLPVAMTLRDAIVNGFLADVAFDLDPQIAYLNTANTFALINTFLAGISLGASTGLPNNPLALYDTSTNGSTYQLISETSRDSNNRRVRVYASNPGGGIVISNGCFYAAGFWTSDAVGGGGSAIAYGTGTVIGLYNTSSSSWSDSSGWTGNLFSVNAAKFDITSTLELGGESSTQTLAAAAVPRINFPLPNTITGDASLCFTLVSEWGPFGGVGITPFFRLYVSTATEEYRLTYNAIWGGDTAGWHSDSSSISSFAYVMNGSFFNCLQHTATASPWAEAAWTAKDLTTVSNLIVTPLGGPALRVYGANAVNDPLIKLQDPFNNNRTIYDHIGFRSGDRGLEFTENWDAVQTAVSATAATLPGFPKWQALFGSGITGALISTMEAGLVAPTTAIDMTLPSNNGNLILATSRALFYLQSFQSIVLEFEIYIGVTGTAFPGSGWSIDVGVTDALNSAGHGITLSAAGGVTNWQLDSGNPFGGANTTSVTTGVPVVTNGLNRLRIEVHGSGTPWGECIHAFVNGSGPAIITTHVPSLQAMNLLVRAGSGSSASALHIVVGQVRCVANRYANPDGL